MDIVYHVASQQQFWKAVASPLGSLFPSKVDCYGSTGPVIRSSDVVESRCGDLYTPGYRL